MLLTLVWHTLSSKLHHLPNELCKLLTSGFVSSFAADWPGLSRPPTEAASHVFSTETRHQAWERRDLLGFFAIFGRTAVPNYAATDIRELGNACLDLVW